jgi:hypothetical protein
MAQQWQFTQDEHSQWRWTRVDDDDHHVQSAASFPDQARCMMDAIRFAVERRRVKPLLDETEPTAQHAQPLLTETDPAVQPH